MCEGNGRNIEKAGWKRLKFILAAGGKVTPKQGGIGAKNHGLRVAFWIGDTIHVQSGGQRTQLTTRSNPSKARFDPGAWDETIHDPDAPTAGTRVSIFYRRQKLSVVGIEGLDLPTADAGSAERLVANIIAEAPLRFIAVTHPIQLPRYVLELVALDGRPTRFVFACRVIGRADGLLLLERTAERQEASGPKRIVLKEQAVRFSLKGLREKRRVSWPFRGPMSAEAELCWKIGTRSLPCAAEGTLRYPIAYPLSAKAVSGYGFHISAPFVSDQARHAPAAGDPVNERIVERAAEVAARILARHLVPATGPAALAVIRPPTRVTEKTTALVVAVGRRGGLPVAVADGTGASSLRHVRRRASPGGVGWPTSHGPVVFPYSSTPASARRLAALVPKELPRLHPDVPEFVVRIFAERNEPAIWRPFRASDAIDRMCGTSRQFPWRSEKQREQEFADPIRVACYLRLLSNEAGIVKARADEIKRLALLPISVGGTAPWSVVEWASSDPPKIPGVMSRHKIIHSKLRSVRLLRRGLLKLQTFNLDRRLASLSWDEAVPAERGSYLAWLVASRRRLKSATLSAISRHSIFEAADGSFHKLEALCLIRDPHLRQAMAPHVKAPSEIVQSLIRLYRSTLKIRSIPTAEECRAWYVAVSGQIAPADGYVLEGDALRELDRLEQTMQLLLKIADAELIAEVKTWYHKTAGKAGHLRPVHALHVPTDAVIACQLAPDDLLDRPAMDLWKILGAREQPSDEAILHVITDGADDAVFYRRLAAYLKAGGDPGALASVGCIRTPTGMKPPVAVAIAGRTSFCGSWKTTIKIGVPERARHLEMIGVLPGTLREQDSRAFFQWLSQQDGKVQAGHCDEIGRHWNESNGPLRWWEADPNLQCLPIRAGGKLLLVSHSQAKARPVYLPDFPEINDQFARTDTRHGVVDDGILPVFPALRKKGIPSLRETLITKGTTIPEGECGPAEKRHQETIRLIRMGASGRTLARELDRVGLGRNSRTADFMRALKQLTEARLAQKIIGRYRIGGETYEAELPAALGDDHILWMTAAASEMALFEAIAHRLLCAGDEAAPYNLYRAVQNLRAEIGSRLIFSLSDGDDEGERSGDEQERKGQSAAPAPALGNGGGDAASGHATLTFKEPAVPNPTPFTHARPEDFAASGKRPSMGRGGNSRTPVVGSTSERRNTVLEETEKTQLKGDHYAFHCQACLGLRQPDDLTPKFTYLWDDEYRSRQLEAHHVKHLQNHGALGAGNLIILCKYHHDFLGDRLDQHEIVRKLRTGTSETRKFGEKRITGKRIHIALDVEPYELRLFFTDFHAQTWFDRATDDAGDLPNYQSTADTQTSEK